MDRKWQPSTNPSHYSFIVYFPINQQHVTNPLQKGCSFISQCTINWHIQGSEGSSTVLTSLWVFLLLITLYSTKGRVWSWWEWVSIYTTQMSDNISAWGIHTPQTHKSATKAPPEVADCSQTTGSCITLPQTSEAKSPIAPRISLWQQTTSPLNLQLKACSILKSPPKSYTVFKLLSR